MGQGLDNRLKAALWMCGAIASFTAMAVSGRAIQMELSTFELMFWRSLIGFLIIAGIVLALRRKAPVQLHPVRPGLHVWRHLVHFTGQNLWFYGLMLIPLSQLVALEFTMPIWVALLAPLFLGERFTLTRIVVALIGFVGILIVARPGTQELNIGHLAAMGAAIGFALNLMLTKRIMRDDSVICVLFWMSLSQGVLALGLSLWTGFHWPTHALWGWLLVIGVTGLSAHYALTSALALVPATVVAPMEFFRLPIISFVGLWLYAELLDPFVFVGAAVIFLANWINYRAARLPEVAVVLPRQRM